MQLEGSAACPSISSSLLVKIMAGEHFSNCNGRKKHKNDERKKEVGADCLQSAHLLLIGMHFLVGP